MNQSVRLLLIQIFAMLLPTSLRFRILRRYLNWQLHPTAKIGISLIDSKDLFLGEQASIGHFNIFRGMNSIRLDDHALIGQWNWFSCASLFRELDLSTTGSFTLGSHSALTSRHYIDCGGGVVIGEFSTVAGVKSTILSHQIDIKNSEQTAVPVSIGDYCFIGSDVRIVPGVQIENRIVVSMGAVVVGHLDRSDWLYGGVPAKPLKMIEGSDYFSREEGRVGLA